jgi:hypothetical protein
MSASTRCLGIHARLGTNDIRPLKSIADPKLGSQSTNARSPTLQHQTQNAINPQPQTQDSHIEFEAKDVQDDSLHVQDVLLELLEGFGLLFNLTRPLPGTAIDNTRDSLVNTKVAKHTRLSQRPSLQMVERLAV